MHVLSRLAAAIPLVTAIWALPTANTSTPSTLYVSHYDGHVYTLSLDTAARKLTLADSLKACGEMPSWVTYDAMSHTLYCVDESGSSANSGNGTLSSFSASENGTLTQTAKTTTLPGGVASVVYEDNDGREYLAIAHYEGSAVSNFKLPITDSSTALQTFEFTLPGPPTDPSRQDAPHPHETFIDPTGAFVLSPDLGSDLIHIFSIDKSSGKLNQCDAFAVKGGNGPRHGAWWDKPGSGDDSTVYALYISNELANTVSIYNVSYSNNCLVLGDGQEMVPYPKNVPSTANVAEVRIAGDKDVYVSVRNDQAFPPNDSMAFLQASASDSALTFTNLTTSYGKTPRTFVINNAGTLLAIGNQASSDVAIVERDPKTGALGELVAQLQVGTQGTPGQSDGLSSVIWAE